MSFLSNSIIALLALPNAQPNGGTGLDSTKVNSNKNMGPAASRQLGNKAEASSQDHQPNLHYLFLAPEPDAVPPVAPTSRPTPTVLCFHGSGHIVHQESWLAVVKGVAEFAPILYYDRRSVSHSQDTRTSGTLSHNETPKDAVVDLRRLLETINLGPPYILVAHSYGGTIARTFLQSFPDQVAGMVLVETGQETPTPFDEEQYQRRILGCKPVSVTHAVAGDSAALAGGNQVKGDARNGTACGQDENRMRQLWAQEDERLKKAQLQLSSNARYVRVDGCGHHVVRDRPDVVIDEVKWVVQDGFQKRDHNAADGEPLSLKRWRQSAIRRLSRR